MEEETTILEFEKKRETKTRLSIFLPANVTTTKSKESKYYVEDYAKCLNLEEQTWKKLYQEQKEYNKQLLMDYKKKQIEKIDYSLFTEEEMEYLNATPDLDSFVEQAKDFQNLLKFAEVHILNTQQKNEQLIERIKKLTNILEIKLSE